MFYKKTDAVILMFDIGSSSSFEELESFFPPMIKYGNYDKPKFLIGNKLDLDRAVTRQ